MKMRIVKKVLRSIRGRRQSQLDRAWKRHCRLAWRHYDGGKRPFGHWDFMRGDLP